MSYKMLLNKEKFLKTEFGLRLKTLLTTWDLALQGLENPEKLRSMAWCQAQWEVYQLAMKQFYGVEYHFTRTDDYFGVVTEDETDWLLKVDRVPASHRKPGTECGVDIGEFVENFTRRMKAYISLLDASQNPDITCCASHQEVKTALKKTRQTADMLGLRVAIERYGIADEIYIDDGVKAEQNAKQGRAEPYLKRFLNSISSPQRVTRRGIKVEEKEYWNEDLMLKFCGSMVNVAVTPNKIYVLDTEGSLITTFTNLATS